MENIKSVSIQYLPTPEEVDSSRQLTAGKFLFPGFAQTFPVAARQVAGGKFRYVTPFENISAEKQEEYESQF